MSLFSAFGLGGFDEDPFMSSRNIFSQMDSMMGMGSMMSRDPFGQDPFFGNSPFPALMGGHRPSQRQQQQQQMISPFALSPFGGMNNMMMSAMGNMSREGSCHSFSSSSVMTMTTGPDGRPQVYQATSSTRAAPGGVRETKKTVNDSRTGVRKMAIGHHINDRSHVIEKEAKDGEMEERQEFINLDESEAPEFDSEFRHLTQQAYGGAGALEHRQRHQRGSSGHRSTYQQALPSSSSYRRRARPMLALTSGTRCKEEDETILEGDQSEEKVKPKKLKILKRLNHGGPSKSNQKKNKLKVQDGLPVEDFDVHEEVRCLEESLVSGKSGKSKTSGKRKNSKTVSRAMNDK